MSRLSLFSNPLLLGFDEYERQLDRVSKMSSEGYPPYNIEQLGERDLRITLAVAGFSEGDLAITVEDNQLIVRGRQVPEDDAGRVFLHRGIAARQFQRSFVLADGLEVTGANLERGLLHIAVTRPLPDPRARTIRITTDATDDREPKKSAPARGAAAKAPPKGPAPGR